MLWTVLIMAMALWIVGMITEVGGNLIHLLLVAAVMILAVNIFVGRRSTLR